MKVTQVEVDMERIMELVHERPGILSSDIISTLGMIHPGNVDHGAQRLARVKKKLGFHLFFQKDGGKTRWFAADYANEHQTPAKIKRDKNKRYDSGEEASTASVKRMAALFPWPLTHVN